MSPGIGVYRFEYNYGAKNSHLRINIYIFISVSTFIVDRYVSVYMGWRRLVGFLKL